MIRHLKNSQFDNKSKLGIIQITRCRCANRTAADEVEIYCFIYFPTPLYTKTRCQAGFCVFGGRVAVPCLFCAPERTLEKDRPRPQRRLPASSTGRGRRPCPLPGGFLCFYYSPLRHSTLTRPVPPPPHAGEARARPLASGRWWEDKRSHRFALRLTPYTFQTGAVLPA